MEKSGAALKESPGRWPFGIRIFSKTQIGKSKCKEEGKEGKGFFFGGKGVALDT